LKEREEKRTRRNAENMKPTVGLDRLGMTHTLGTNGVVSCHTYW